MQMSNFDLLVSKGLHLLLPPSVFLYTIPRLSQHLEERSLWGCGGRAPNFPVNTSQIHKGWSQKPFEAPWGWWRHTETPLHLQGGISSLLLPYHLWRGLLPLLPTSGYITNSARLYTFSPYIAPEGFGEKSRVKVSLFCLIPSIKEIH